MGEEDAVARVATGAACVIFDPAGRVLLVHHTYGRLNWELPGGLAEPGEGPHETALRELREETGVSGVLDRLTGVYLEAGHDFGPFLHFVFACHLRPGDHPVPASSEVSEVRHWPVDELPGPISDFTERRISDAQMDGPIGIVRVGPRLWRR